MIEKSDVEKIEDILKGYQQVHGSFTSKGSKVYDSYTGLLANSTKEGALSKMYKELIGLGIASVVYCEPCIVWHIGEALRSGASEEQIVEAIEVAIEMGGGPVVGRSSFSFKVLEYFKSKAEEGQA